MYRDEFRKLIWLALPLCLAQLAQNTLSLIDTIMVGRILGDQQLSGMAIGSTTFHFVLMIFSGVLYAVSPMVSHAVGANDLQAIPRIVRQSFWVGVFAFIPGFVLFWNAEMILRAMGQGDQVVELSSSYLRAISFGMLPALLSVSLRGFLEGTSHTKPILLISLAGVGMNVFTNDMLMNGRYGVPEMGLVGTGIASSIVYTLTFAITAIYVWYCRREHHVFSELHRPHVPTILEILKIGGPICMTVAFEGCMFAGATYAMGRISSDPIESTRQLAAHQIALQSASITFMIPLGIALATCVRVGQFAGAKDREGARRAGWVGIFTAVVAMTFGAFVFSVFPEWVIWIYLDPEKPKPIEVIAYAVAFLQIAALFQLVDGIQVAASNCLRGLKRTREAMVLTLIAYWVIGIPACWFLGFTMGLQGRGLWYGLTVGLAASAALLTWRFHREFASERRKSISSATKSH